MGAQSIKIPVELELRQLQGPIQTLKNALEKVKPGTKVYENLSKSLDKIEHQFYSLENASKKSFKNVGEINAFEKAFEKVANSISDVASDFKRLNFADLSADIFSKEDIQRIQEASNKIKKVQTDIDNLRSDKFKEVASSSDEIKKAFSDLEIDIDTSNIDDAIKSIKNNLRSLSNQIGGKTRSINTKKNQLNLLETQAAAISSLRTGQGLTLAEKFGANFFDNTGKAFKDENSKQALVEMLAGLGLSPSNLVKVQQSTAEDLDNFSDNIINTLKASAAKMRQDIERITKTELPTLELEKQQLTAAKAQQDSALKQLTAIDPSLTAELEKYKQELNEAREALVELKQELAQARVGQETFNKVNQDSADSVQNLGKNCNEAKDSLENFNRAQEKLNDIKFAIKNWFGFNEVINLTKNAVRNMITQIRELDDVMTQIAIVTDMTQQELWDQMDTYSAMAQQYGASIKGVYEVSQLYYQQGLQTAEVMNLTEETLKMAKIANLDYAEATDYMTVALRGFKLEMSDAQQVTDVYSALAAATASDTEELAVAMSKTASSAEAVGSSFESTSAMIATMISITREAPENIGSALKSIISRYGEMTSDPMKLVDSEGEEMSLNKVDKALQSVGISLQDAQGQFRNFDDVILELSKSWDTIDTNTQRYIATVMAGNRQQSRFLALVGNYEEYAKALEVAENAEDAGTLQTLKTMDSISTKWEQLKVSLQEFYTSAGLEDIFKGVLDALTAFLTKANDIPKLFGKIPVSVIALVSSLITSIKNVATSLTTSLMGPISEFNSKLDELAKKNIEIKVKAVPETGSGTQARQVLENEAKQGGPITTNKNPLFTKEEYSAIDNYFKKGDEKSLQKLKEITGLDDNDIKQLKQELDGLSEAERKALGLSDDFAKKLSDTPSLFDKVKNSIGKLQNSSFGKFFSKNAGSISLVTSALSAYALTIKDAASATVEGSKTISGGLNTIGGLALGIFGGQWQYAIPMLISGIPTLIDGLIYTTEEKLKNATEKATELSNISLQKKSDYKNLKNETKELENLTEARHDSAEAYQEWLDYNNQMASSYPELISYIDSEGNAIIDLAASYNSLEIARLAAAKAAKESIVADLDQAKIDKQNSDEKLSNFYKNIDTSSESAFSRLAGFKIEANQTSLENITEESAISFLNNYFNKLGLAIDEETQKQINETGKFLSTSTDFKNFLASPDDGAISKSIFNTLAGDLDLGGIINLAELQNYTKDFTKGITQPSENYNFLTDEVNEAISIYEQIKAETKSAEDLIPFISDTDKMKEISKVVVQARKDSTENGDAYDQAADALEELVTLHGSYQALVAEQALKDKQLAATNRKAISTYAYYDNEASERKVGEELNNFNEIVTDYLVKKWKESEKEILDYLGTDESRDYEEFEKAFQKIWQNLSSSQQAALNELLASGENYNRANYEKVLIDSGVSKDSLIYKELMQQWTEEYGLATINFRKAIRERKNKSLLEGNQYISSGIENLQDIAPKYYDEILDFYDKVNLQISDGLISQLQGSDILNAYSSLWQQSKGLENEAEIQKILAEGDFTSLDGIYSLKESLEKAGFDANIILENLANSINVNVLTEWETFGQKVKTGLESFTEALTNATKGMDYEDAINMASKLEMSLSDFRFEDGEYFLDNIEAIQRVYGNFGEELKKTLITETDKKITELYADLADATDKITYDKINNQIVEIQTAQENVESSVNEYIAYHTNLAYLTAGLYDGFIQQIGGSGSVAEMLTAGRESDTKLREYLLTLGSENITEETVDGYVAAITDRISSVNDSILSLILDKNVGKGGSADISHLVEKTDLEGFTKITAEKIPELFAKMFGENYEAYNDAMLQYMEDSSADISGMIADLAGDIEHIDYSSVFEIANALGKNVNEIIGLFTDNLDGTFSTSLNNIQTLAQITGIGITSEIQDAIREYLNNILGIVSNGISGSMTNVEFETLSNFMDLDLDFTETSEGLKLTKASAIEVYTELKKIDSIQAQITFSDLAESLEEAGSGYEDVASTMATIAKLNKELANVPVSSERRVELERELAVAEEILRVRSQDPDSFNFMDKDLPTGMQGPENYWNSVGEAYKVMNESAKSGYMEIQDYVNIVNQMEAMAIAAGQEFSIGGMNAAQLIEKGMSSLKNIDGEGVKIAMEGVGIDFANAATDMGLSFDDGIKEVAKSQIKMLDAAIRMLEAMVAMENIDANGDGFLGLEEIFKEGANLEDGIQESDWDKDVIEWADNLQDAAGKISIGGKSLLDALATLSPEQVQNVLNQLMSIDWTLGDTDIASQIQNVLSAYFPDVDITQGKSVFDILEIPDDADTKAEHFTEWLNKVGLAAEDYDLLKKTLDNNYKIGTEDSLFQSIEKMLGLEEGDNRFENLYSNLKDLGYGIQDAIKIWDEITVTDEDGKTTYTYNGTDYTDLNSALAARRMSEKSGEKISDVTTEAEGGVITAKGTVQAGETTIEVLELKTGSLVYLDSQGQGHSTLREAIDSNVKSQISQEGISEIEAYAQYGIDITADKLSKVSVSGIKDVLSSDAIGKAITDAKGGAFSITIDGQAIEFEAGTTEEQVRQKLMEAIGIDAAQMETIVTAISTAISTANWAPVGDAIATALKTNIGQGESGAEAIEIGELTLKPKGLKVDTSKAGEPTLSSGEEALGNVPITSLTLTPETLYIDIVNKTPQLKEGQTVTIENIPSATGTVTGSITITNNGTWSAAEGQTSPEVTGYTSANGTVETVTINGSSFKVTPVTGAPTNLDGELNPIESGFVKVEGNYYSVDLTSGIQLNPGMDLSGVTAGSAQVEATSYSVTFTNANGTTETVIVQGEAQLNAVLQNATLGDNGGWTLNGISAEADVSISTKSENALINFFETLVNKLKNIEVTYQEPTSAGPGPNTSTPGYYVEGFNTSAGSIGAIGKNKGYFDSMEQVISSCDMGVETGTFQDGTFNITEIKADGTQLTATDVALADLQADTVNFSGIIPSDSSDGGTDGGSGDSNTGGETSSFNPLILTAAIEAIGTAANTAVENINGAVTTLTSIDTSPITTASSRVWSLISAMNSIKSSPASRIWGLVSAINAIPSSKTISIGYTVSVNVTGTGIAAGRITHSNADSWSGNSASGTLAKGNVALAKGTGNALVSGSRKTLMGELGPELVVSNGRYFIVGQNGAEFVDLADDAIVFNHLQTDKLIKHGHTGTGKPVTNETKAVSLATGNVGPAMASASAALTQLRQIRAMWQSMLDASARDLGSMGGSSGGGGGGGGGGGEDTAAVLADVEKWYNWLRQIEHIEEHISLLEAQRANIQDGKKYFENLQEELKLLEKQRDIQLDLAKAQKKYYDARRKALKDSTYGKIFTYDENGLMQYQSTPEGTTNKKDFKGLDILEELNKRDENGKAVYNAKEQLAYLKSLGFDTETLKINDDGTKAEKAEDQMQNFWDEVDAWKDELDSLYDSYHKLTVDAENNTEKMNEILQEYIDNQLSVEEKLRQAIEDREQAEIDKLEKEKEVFEEASQAYIDGLSEALSKEQDMYNKNETNEETSRLQRQLAILQRSGGSASEIKSLQDQIDSRLKDAYFQEQQDQIDAIQEASDNQLEKLQTQIDLMTETLEYQKEHGLLWNEVYEMMNQWTPEQMLQFIEQYTKSYQENSKLQNDENSKETLKELQLYTAKRDQDAIDAAANERNAAWLEYYKSLTQYSEEFKTKHQENARKAFNDAYGTGDLAAGKAAADKVFSDAKKAEEKAPIQSPPAKEEEAFKGFKAKNNTGAHSLYAKNNRSGKRVGSVANGEEVTILGKGTKGIVYVENKSGKKGFMKLASLKVLDSDFKFNDLPQYEKGGTIDFTGLAMVHGSKNNPESILSAEHTKLLKNGIFSNSNHSLAATVEAIQELANNIATSGGTAETGINIEHLSVEIQPGVISSDYDARRAGEMALEEMVRIARKTTNRIVSR